MTRTAVTEAHGETVARLLATRTRANREFFATHAERLAQCCHRMAERFARGGRLVALGRSPSARSDARHIAVEFVHPVIVGKRALPAIGLAGEGGPLTAQVEAVTEPADIAIAFGLNEDGSGATAEALAQARDAGCLTIAFGDSVAEWTFDPPGVDPFVDQELVETLYHVLWELVHVFFDHRGLLAGRDAGPVHDAGSSSFLYPFLSEGETDLDKVVADVRRSILMKAAEVESLREQTLRENRAVLVDAAADLRERFEAGGKLLAFGNGGSATDAMDLVADLRHPPRPDWAPRRAIDLTEDTSVLTAIANDIGVDEVFQRQVIAYGAEGDVAVALSTSGNSANIVQALVEARARGLGTIAFVGYDGGRVAADELADHVVITRSHHIPRIQEAQASAYHVLRELIETRQTGT
jgi:D-sedoheptulose 7-phosphate isomerase